MFLPIGQSVEGKVAALGLSRSLAAAVILAKVTEWGSGRWQATKFRSGQLTLVAPSSIAASELYASRERLVGEINTFLGQEVIKKLIVRT